MRMAWPDDKWPCWRIRDNNSWVSHKIGGKMEPQLLRSFMSYFTHVQKIAAMYLREQDYNDS